MPSSTLDSLVEAHHLQAGAMARRTFRVMTFSDAQSINVTELKRVGRKFTTKVERRLRKLEMGAT